MKPSPMFELGHVVATANALRTIEETKGGAGPARVFITALINRHVCADWGCCSDNDRAANDAAIAAQGEDAGRVLSAYALDDSKPCKGHGDNCVWIITEWDRSVTTVLLPEDY